MATSIIRNNRIIKEMGFIIFGALLIFLTAQVSIPLKPVPITLQTVGVLLIGLKFRFHRAVGSVLTYLLLGAIGLPVFSNFNYGYNYLLGPVGGYLIGFLAAVALMSWLSEKLNKENLFYITLNCLLGQIVIYSLGISWLALFIGFKAAIVKGLLPFIIPGVVKILMLAILIRYLSVGKLVS